MAHGNDAISKSFTRHESFVFAIFLLWFLLPLTVALIGELFFKGTALATNPKLGFYVSVMLLWALLVSVLWWLLSDVRKLKLIDVIKQRPFGLVSLFAGYLFLLLPYFCRRIIEIAAFAGLNAPTTEAYLSVSYATGRNSWNYNLVGPIFGQGGRLVSIKVNEELRWHYSLVSTHNNDCIRVLVQSGRQGYQRIIGPGLFDEGIGKGNIVKDCKSDIPL